MNYVLNRVAETHRRPSGPLVTVQHTRYGDGSVFSEYLHDDGTRSVIKVEDLDQFEREFRPVWLPKNLTTVEALAQLSMTLFGLYAMTQEQALRATVGGGLSSQHLCVEVRELRSRLSEALHLFAAAVDLAGGYEHEVEWALWSRRAEAVEYGVIDVVGWTKELLEYLPGAPGTPAEAVDGGGFPLPVHAAALAAKLPTEVAAGFACELRNALIPLHDSLARLFTALAPVQEQALDRLWALAKACEQRGRAPKSNDLTTASEES